MIIHYDKSYGPQNNTLSIIQKVVLKEGTYEKVICMHRKKNA
jgi:hypothetical protein